MKTAFRWCAPRVILFAALNFCIAGSGNAVAAEGVTRADMDMGQGLFLVNCRLCHGTTGKAGVPLRENKNLEDSNFVVTMILQGRGYMSSFSQSLDDTQIAAIATFVRNSWGNDYGPVTPDEVAAAR